MFKEEETKYKSQNKYKGERKIRAFKYFVWNLDSFTYYVVVTQVIYPCINTEQH